MRSSLAISTLMTFKRMKPITSALSTEEITAALRESAELLEIDESGTKVKRKLPLKLVSEFWSCVNEQSVSFIESVAMAAMGTPVKAGDFKSL